MVILIADELSPTDVIRTALSSSEDEGHGVVQFHEGSEALDYLRRLGRYNARPPGLPRVLLLDLEAPQVEGLELLAEMKRDPQLCVVPIVCLGSAQQADEVRRSYALGANAYVLKPVDPDELATRIQRITLFWTQANEPPPSLN